jgi:hypothetical protein
MVIPMPINNRSIGQTVEMSDDDIQNGSIRQSIKGTSYLESCLSIENKFEQLFSVLKATADKTPNLLTEDERECLDSARADVLGIARTICQRIQAGRDGHDGSH